MTIEFISRMTVSQQRFLILFGLGMTWLGCALRVAGAMGDLAIDEVHSLMLLQSIHRADEVFWHINHDNNHYLNTLYLFFVGPDHSPVVLRLEAIVLGTLSIPAAGLAAFGQRRDALAAAAAMLFCAITYPAVHYGSEARGYAGLVLFSFLAIYLVEGGLQTTKRQALLGIVTLFGVLSYLFMAFVIVGLMLWHGIRILRPRQDPFEVLFIVSRQFWGAILAILAVIACIKFGSIYHGFIHGGGDEVTSFVQMAGGIDRFFDLSMGIYAGEPIYLGIVAAICFVCLLALHRKTDSSQRLAFYVIAMGGYISWLFLFGRHGLHQPRYCMPMLAPLILMLANCTALGLKSPRVIQSCTIFLLAAFCIGTTSNLAHFYAEGRGHYKDVVVAMTKNGPATYTSDAKFGHSQIVEYYATRLGVDADFIPWKDTCVIPPDWLIHSDLADHSPPIIETSPGPCQNTYVHPQVFPYWGLTGWQWTLYRRDDTTSSAVPDRK